MFLVGVLCLFAAAIIAIIVESLPSMSLFEAFLSSWLACVFVGASLRAKESRLKRGPISAGARFLAVSVVLAALSLAVKPYLALWRTHSGFWSEAFLVWLALLALSMIWVPFQGGEEEGNQVAPGNGP